MIKTKVQLEAENDANIDANGVRGISGTILNALFTNFIDSFNSVIQSYTTAQKNALTPTLADIVFDTDLNEFNFYDGTRWVSFAHPKYKVYTALLTQTGTNAPTATVLENTLGGTVVWSYNSVGNYTATLAGAFPASKTGAFVTGGGGVGSAIDFIRVSDDALGMETWSVLAGAEANNILQGSLIEIRVYY